MTATVERDFRVSAGGLVARLSRRLSRGLIKWTDTMLAWQAHRRQLRHLASLDDWLLRDIGLRRGDVERVIRDPRGR
ncbi:MAG: DUF1127 domain-containing protein [Azospirillaceae bacterium]|nr:DUF1127 domain-containing protein [Azospirillaceae bacterium]